MADETAVSVQSMALRVQSALSAVTLNALTDALSANPNGGGGGGLPVPPLLKLISEYVHEFEARVSLWLGSSTTSGYADGSRAEALFRFPTACAVATGADGLLTVMITEPHAVRQYHERTDTVSLAAGEKEAPGLWWNGKSFGTVRFAQPMIVAADPFHAGRWYVADRSSIRLLDTSCESDNPVQLLCGGGIPGADDGYVDESRCKGPCGIVVRPPDPNTTDSESPNANAALIFCDTLNSTIRSIDLRQRRTRTIAGSAAGVMSQRHADGVGAAASFQSPRQCAWSRLPSDKPYCVLFISSLRAIRRLDVDSGRVTTIALTLDINPVGITSLPSGVLIVSCFKRNSLFSVDPESGVTTRVAGMDNRESEYADGRLLGEATFKDPNHLTFLESEYAIAVVDQEAHCIRKVTLPVHLFPQLKTA